MPHMGWNDVRPAGRRTLFTGLEDDARFYFLHSYYFECPSRPIRRWQWPTTAFNSIAQCGIGNVYGVQFHPEKSHHWGAALLKNFAELLDAAAPNHSLPAGATRGLVKTVEFKDRKYVGDPINAVKIFNEKEADELVVLDIDATVKGPGPDYTMIANLAAECRMPLCYGGGVVRRNRPRRSSAWVSRRSPSARPRLRTRS